MFSQLAAVIRHRYLQDTLFQAHFSDVAKLVPGQLRSAAGMFLPALQDNGQHDAHEFLHLIFEALDRVALHPGAAQCDLTAPHGFAPRALSQCHCGTPPAHMVPCDCSPAGAARPPSLATHVFGGVLQSDVTCACGNVSSRSEPFMDLSVDVGHHIVGASQGMKRRSDDAVDGAHSEASAGGLCVGCSQTCAHWLVVNAKACIASCCEACAGDLHAQNVLHAHRMCLAPVPPADLRDGTALLAHSDALTVMRRAPYTCVHMQTWPRLPVHGPLTVCPP